MILTVILTMFIWKVLVPLVLALARQSKAHFNSACGTLGIIGVGSDTLSSQFNVYAFPHNTNPHSTANGTALGVNQDSVLGRVCLFRYPFPHYQSRSKKAPLSLGPTETVFFFG